MPIFRNLTGWVLMRGRYIQYEQIGMISPHAFFFFSFFLIPLKPSQPLRTSNFPYFETFKELSSKVYLRNQPAFVAKWIHQVNKEWIWLLWKPACNVYDRYGTVIDGCIDWYSCLIFYLQCYSKNSAVKKILHLVYQWWNFCLHFTFAVTFGRLE